eukprot:s145_g17.t1
MWPNAVRVEQIWTSLREAVSNETEEAVGSKQAMSMAGLAAYLTLNSGQPGADVENILHDEFTAVQELATWEEPMTEDGLWLRKIWALRGRQYFLTRQVGMNSNVKHTNEELLAMGKANFVRLVSAFKHSLAGSAQEKIHQRSDLEAMVEQIGQGSLEDEAHELLQCWKEGKMCCNNLVRKVLPQVTWQTWKWLVQKQNRCCFKSWVKILLLDRRLPLAMHRASAGRGADDVEGSYGAEAGLATSSENQATVGIAVRQCAPVRAVWPKRRALRGLVVDWDDYVVHDLECLRNGCYFVAKAAGQEIVKMPPRQQEMFPPESKAIKALASEDKYYCAVNMTWLNHAWSPCPQIPLNRGAIAKIQEFFPAPANFSKLKLVVAVLKAEVDGQQLPAPGMWKRISGGIRDSFLPVSSRGCEEGFGWIN